MSFWLTVCIGSVMGREMTTPQGTAEPVSITVYGFQQESEPVLTIKGGNAIQVPLVSGQSAIFSQDDVDLTLEQEFEAVAVEVSASVSSKHRYRGRVGQIRNFDLAYSSGSSINHLNGLEEGLLWGFGLGWVLSPGSIVSTAVSLDLDYTRRQSRLDRFESDGLVSATNLRIEQDEFQAAVNISRRWKQLEPYGGFRVFRVTSRLKDRSSKRKMKGSSDGISPYIGLRLPLFSQDGLILEGSFLDEQTINVGINIPIGNFERN